MKHLKTIFIIVIVIIPFIHDCQTDRWEKDRIELNQNKDENNNRNTNRIFNWKCNIDYVVRFRTKNGCCKSLGFNSWIFLQIHTRTRDK